MFKKIFHDLLGSSSSQHQESGICNDLDPEMEVPLKKYTMDSSIGNGINYEYFCGTDHQNPDIKVTLKVLKSGSEKIFYDEIKAMKNVLKHQNILNLLEHCTKGPQKYLVFDYANHGNLSYFLRNYQRDNVKKLLPLSEQNFIDFSIQIANGVHYLNNIGIIHYDLAACNILVFKEFHQNYVLKVTDFWKPSNVTKSYYTKKTYHGRRPYRWQAPESLTDNEFTEKSNVWSFAVVMWEIYSFCLIRPYPDITSKTSLINFFKNGKRLPKPELCSSQVVFNLMMDCWTFNTYDRKNFNNIILELGKLNLDWNLYTNLSFLQEKAVSSSDESEESDN